MNAKKVIESLKKGDCKEALKWCNENKSKLKKMKVFFYFFKKKLIKIYYFRVH